MEFLSNLIDDLVQSVQGIFQKSKDAYEGSGRFQKWRLWVIGALVLDVALVGVVFAAIGLSTVDLEAWYQPSFPSNLVIVRNNGAALGPATIVLDGVYRLEGAKLEPGVNGFELERRFRNSKEEHPSASYQPSRLRLTVDGNDVEIEVRSHR